MVFSNILFHGHHYAILGLGKNGVAAAHHLLAMGATVQIWDDQEKKRQETPKDLQDFLTPFQTLKHFDALVLSPGIPHNLPKPHPVAQIAQDENIPILSDAELLYRAVKRSGSKAKFVAITGTNGKSTTTVLLTHLLTEAGIPAVAGGNLGPAALSLPYLPDHGVYVLEMSSYMLERLPSFTADIACLLNITPDHLERHGDLQGYITAKLHIFDRQTHHQMAVIGVEDNYSVQIAQQIAQKGIETCTITGKNLQADFYVKNHILYHHHESIADLQQAPLLPGTHNAQNAAATTAMALKLGVSKENIQLGFHSFTGLAHRQRPVATVEDVTFINDSKATNADAASKALTCYDELIWIAGGLAKANGIDELFPYFPRIKLTLLIGQDAPLLAECLEKYHVQYEIVNTMENAVPRAFEYAKLHQIKTVLLSPACASFDQFASFEERGDIFAKLVTKLKVSS